MRARVRDALRDLPRLTVLLVVLAVLLPVGAYAATRLGDAPDPGAPAQAATPSTLPAAAPTTTASGVPEVEVEGETATAAEPVRVRVPRAGIDVAVEDLRTDPAGRLESPRAWQRAGWFTTGPAPGEVGPAVLAGHVDSPSGPAAFTGLDVLRPGDEVEVDRTDGTTVTFVVDRTEVVAKGDFPTTEVYGPTPDAQLRLITCDGPYVRSSGGYQGNLVVHATQVDR